VSSLYPSQSAGKRIYWLLTIEWSGLVIRLANDQVDVESDTGAVYQFSAGLDDVEVSEAIDLIGDSAGQLSVPLEFIPPGDVSITERIALGDDFSAARGELSRWVEGTNYEERRVVLRGRLTDPEYGADGEPIATSLEEMLIDDQTLVPSPFQLVASASWFTFADLPSTSKGAPYPIVIGKPGRVSTSISVRNWVTGSPGIWVYHDPHDEGAFYSRLILLIAGHHVRARRVYLNHADDTLGKRFRVVNGWDDLGQPIAFVPFYLTTTSDQQIVYDGTATYTTYNATDPDFSPAGPSYGLGDKTLDYDTWQADPERQLYVGWYDGNDDDSATGGGLMMEGGIVREAGDVIEYLLGLTSQTVDRARIAAAKPLLSRFLLDGVITDRISPWDVLKDEILSLLPVSICSGPNGLYLIVWRFDATAADATVRIDADANPAIDRVDRVKYDDSERANRLSLSYAYSYRTSRHVQTLTFGTAADKVEDDAVVIHPACERGRARTGVVAERSVSSAWVYDDATAYAVLEWMAAAYATSARSVQYRVPESEFVHVERGMVATLTDADLYLSDAVSLVREVVTDGSGYLTLTLWMLDNPQART
jgi:hypothetical protein